MEICPIEELGVSQKVQNLANLQLWDCIENTCGDKHKNSVWDPGWKFVFHTNDVRVVINGMRDNF